MEAYVPNIFQCLMALSFSFLINTYFFFIFEAVMASEITVIVCDHNFMSALRKCYRLLRKNEF